MATALVRPLTENLQLAGRALRSWTPRQFGVALVAAAVTAVLIGVPTVLIPNPIFGREIDPVWWDYPVWIGTSLLTGLLLATYVRPSGGPAPDGTAPSAVGGGDEAERRVQRFGVAGTMLAWFAVGCPVCNKLALIVLGYSGALRWFAPAQPFLAAVAVVATVLALIWRLRGQVACPMPRRSALETV